MPLGIPSTQSTSVVFVVVAVVVLDVLVMEKVVVVVGTQMGGVPSKTSLSRHV